jgi:hypothetical protein
MEDVVREFFEGIATTRPWVPKTISGTLRFDLEDEKRAEHWLVTFDHGSVAVSRANASIGHGVGTSQTVAPTPRLSKVVLRKPARVKCGI